ncbi:acyl-homoserine-lactone synthase [Aureimonas psammosilenae]|uniref:acyl-homoserine-lactone synthase n=1 Tax=Aureimonas psammosilenae TaxID=2495496 RepID=UPI001260C39B|nr:acyl-homoserine-lactone synthase [Aureimonas psammosilenae]
MIVVVEGAAKHERPDLIADMHRLRKRVFHGRLGWDVTIEDDYEIDVFDDANPLYLISVADEGAPVRGCLRLLPTMGPNMLRDVFPELLPGQTVESPLIWESTRFAVDLPSRNADGSRAAARLVGRITGELVAGAIEVGLAVGLTHIVSVFDARILRVLRAAGCSIELIGEARTIGSVLTHAGLFEVSEEVVAAIREVNGLEGSLFDPTTAARLFAA